MNVLAVYAHPYPGSFNHALLEAELEGLREAGHTATVRDLYADPIKTNLDAVDLEAAMGGTIPGEIRREQELVAGADGLLFQYPVWWFATPSILKGWIDRVFLQGFAFSLGPEGPKGLLSHEKALVVNTTGGLEEDYDAAGNKDVILRPVTDGVLRFCGVRDVAAKTFFGVPYVSEEVRKLMLAEARELGRTF